MLQRLKKIYTRKSESQMLPDYEQLYETHARAQGETDVIGVGDFQTFGALELRFLELAGLGPSMSILDFGCGIGRLAQQLVPGLDAKGSYLGVDISKTMLSRAEQRLSSLNAACPYTLLHGDGGVLNTLEPASIDIACAFSVFTHMDLEDTYLHLQCLKRVLKPDGMLVSSHLLLPESEDARNIFSQSSALPYQQRRAQVLSVVSCREMFDTVVQMAGLEATRWIPGSDAIKDKQGNLLGAFGQAVAFNKARAIPN